MPLFFFFICLLFIFEHQVEFAVKKMRNQGQQKIDIFKCLYETHASSLIRFAKRFASARIAEDLVQDVFLEIWKNDKDLDYEYSRSYLYTAVQNRCINFLKQEQHKKIYIQNTQAEDREINFSDGVLSNDNTEQMQRIYHQIDLLPGKCRQIFKLAYIEEKKSAEIAELLKLSIRTVEHQLYLGLKILRQNLLQTGNNNTNILFLLLRINGLHLF